MKRKRYEEVADELRQMVATMPENDKLPSIRSLMQQFNVSQATLDRSLNTLEGNGFIRRCSGQGYYVPEKNFCFEMQSRVVFVFCYHQEHMSNPLYGAIIARFLQKMDDLNNVFEILPCDETEDVVKFRERFSSKKFNKCIIMGCSKQSFLYALHDMGIEIVQIYPNVLSRFATAILIDNKSIIEQLVEHFCQLGHKRLAMVHGQGFEHVNMLDQEERMEAFYAALRKRGLVCSPRSMIYGGFDVDSGYRAGMQLLNTIPELRPTAIIANDYNAGGIYRAAGELGLRIPEDLSIAGIDNLPLCQCIVPPLTSIDINWSTAVDMAIDLLRNGGGEAKIQLVATRLVERASTGMSPDRHGG